MAFLFSPNQDFENLVSGQRLFELIGYAQNINVQNTPYPLLKFTLTNGKAKITCVIFGERHLPELVQGRIIHLDGGVVRSEMYPVVGDHPCHIVIDNTSMIKYFGIYDP